MDRITALTHPLMDILVPCSAVFLQEHGLTPGTYGLLNLAEQDALLSACSSLDQPMVVGGSAVNSVTCARQLGVSCTVLGLVGDDAYGHHIYKQLKARDIQIPIPHVPFARTGTCVSLITPDGERTMRTCLGVSTDLAKADVHESAIVGSAWLLVEGYFLTASEKNRSALHSAVAMAKSSGTKIAFTVSAEFVVQARGEEILQFILPNTDLIFSNEGEAMLLTKTTSAEAALEVLSKQVRSVIVTCGSKGALGVMGGEHWHTPSAELAAPAVDTTGAGDIFAGSFLAGLVKGLSPAVAAHGAAHLAALVVQRHGAQLPDEAVATWQSVVQSKLS